VPAQRPYVTRAHTGGSILWTIHTVDGGTVQTRDREHAKRVYAANLRVYVKRKGRR